MCLGGLGREKYSCMRPLAQDSLSMPGYKGYKGTSDVEAQTGLSKYAYTQVSGSPKTNVVSFCAQNLLTSVKEPTAPLPASTSVCFLRLQPTQYGNIRTCAAIHLLKRAASS